MKRLAFLFLLLLALATSSFGDNTHGQPNAQKELGAWFGQALSPYIASNCLPTVPSSSLTLAAFACAGYVQDATGAFVYVTQAAATLTLANTNGIHWLAISQDTSSTVSSWSRRAGSHYLFRQVTAKPDNPTGGLIFAKITVAAGVITAVGDYRLPSSYARSRVYDVTDPLYNTSVGLAGNATAGLQATLNAVHDQGGGVITVPAGTYRTTAALTVYPLTTLQGMGRKLSTLFADHAGNGITLPGTVNAVASKYVTLRALGLDKTTSASAGTGGGFVDLAGAYLELDNVFIRDFAQQIILDQSEHVHIHDCEFISGDGEYGLWLVDGPERTATALPGYTNVVSVHDNQFNAVANSTAVHIVDDGGSAHNVYDNNINAGATGIRAANTSPLTITGNFFEGQTTEAITMAFATKGAGTFYYVNHVPRITSNAFSTLTATALYHISLASAWNGDITNNVFIGRASMTAMVLIQDDGATGNHIARNTKDLRSISADIPFLATTLDRVTANDYQQRLFTSHALAVVAGAGVVFTPRSMGFLGTREAPRVGDLVTIANADYVLTEQALVTAVSTTTFTATIVNSYAANFLLFGMNDTSREEPSGTQLNAGTGTVASGATTVTITHGLVYSPSPLPGEITLTRTGTTTNLVSAWWVSGITATVFVVNVNTDPGAGGFGFAWKIHRPYRK